MSPTLGAPCDDGDGCTVGSTCDANKTCKPSKQPLLCDDGNPCTADSCLELGAWSQCLAKALPDGSKCTVEGACGGAGSCLAGQCKPSKVSCGTVVYTETFACGQPSKWSSVQVATSPYESQTTLMTWRVDRDPYLPAPFVGDCTLNVQETPQLTELCETQNFIATTWSPEIKLPSAPAVLTLRSYFPTPIRPSSPSIWAYETPFPYWDKFVWKPATTFATRKIQVFDTTTKLIVMVFQLPPVDAPGFTSAAWRLYSFPLAKFAGGTVRIGIEIVDDFTCVSPGWFVDDVRVQVLN